jgi:hypothetical protein
VFAGGLCVPARCIDPDDRFLRLALTPKLATRARRHGIVVLCRPARAGSPDRRRLGMPLASVEIVSG